jgi:2-C-methyl-D-erythritol 2,4-cyclodiphosphate synthase
MEPVIEDKRSYMRVGIGYDVHRLVEDRELIIGGVKIPFSKGLLGHSDADVLVHSIIDTLLGAAALGDIGQLFPDDNETYKGISSLKLLKEVADLLEQKRFVIENIDSTLIAQSPKLAPYIQQMIENIARTLEINTNQVNVKATTEEKLGFTGREEGIAAQAICNLTKITNLSSFDIEETDLPGGPCSSCKGCPKD